MPNEAQQNPDEAIGYCLYSVTQGRYIAQGNSDVKGHGWRLATSLAKARTFVKLEDAAKAADRIAGGSDFGMVEVRQFAIRPIATNYLTGRADIKGSGAYRGMFIGR